MGKYIMALDQGTTSSRTILFDKGGNIICQANKEFEQIFPKAGWVEHNPEEIWMTQVLTMGEVMREAGIDGTDIEAIGITNQRETTVVWDKNTGKPIYNAIVWQCRRTSDIVDKLVADGLTDTIKIKTGLVPDAYFSGTKIKWILDNVAGAREKAEKGEINATKGYAVKWNFRVHNSGTIRCKNPNKWCGRGPAGSFVWSVLF